MTKNADDISKQWNFKVLLWIKKGWFRTYFAFLTAYRAILGKRKFLIVSFPKSGRTWVRVLMAKYLELKMGTPFNIEFPEEVVPGYSLDFSHSCYSISFLHQRKVAIITRDPRDVLISYYYARSFRRQFRRYKGTLSEFIRSRWGVPRILEFYNQLTLEQSETNSFHYVSYEGLQSDPGFELTKLLEYFEIPIDLTLVDKAVEFSSFENMKRMETDRKFKNKRIEPYDTDNLDSVKVRKGKVGGYKQDLPKEDLQWINERMKNSLNDRAKSMLGIGHLTRTYDN